jgi:hypothetical protein
MNPGVRPIRRQLRALPARLFIHEFHRKGRGGDGDAGRAAGNACGNASMPGRWIPSRAAPPYGAQLAGLEPRVRPADFFSHRQERDMNVERDAWLDEVMQARPTGMHFKTAWIIACALYRGDSNALALVTP